MRDTVIFDMDGLMVDTEPLSRRAWDEVLAAYECRLDDALYGRIIGHRTPTSAQLIIDTFDLPLTRDELVQMKSARYKEIRAEGVPVMPGLFALVAELGRRAIPWGVATSSPVRHAAEILTQLDLTQQCQVVAAGDEVVQGKPAPDIYLLAATRLGANPANCLALEDSAPGCRAALAAGMQVVAIPNGMTHTVDFAFAPFQCISLREVRERLDELLG